MELLESRLQFTLGQRRLTLEAEQNFSWVLIERSEIKVYEKVR